MVAAAFSVRAKIANALTDAGSVPMSRLNRPISAHFHSGGWKLFYLGEDFGESIGEPVEWRTFVNDGERAAEHHHDVLCGE